MSIETAMAALNTPATPTPTVPQQQAISPKEVAAATVEQEASTKVESATPEVKDSGVEAKVAETPKTELSSAKFSALAKKEKAIVSRSQELKTKESALADKEAAISAREAKIKQSEELWDKDVFAALEARGYSYSKLTDLMLEGKTAAPAETDPIKVAKKTIDDFKKELAQKEEERELAAKNAALEATAKQKADLEAAWESYNNEVNDYVETNKDDYELINTYAQQSLIAETVDAFYQKNKRVLSVKEASDMVESYLESEAEKALNTKKIGGRVTKNVTLSTSVKKEEEPRITKTLNNTMQPTAASVLPVASEADRMKRALAAMDSKR